MGCNCGRKNKSVQSDPKKLLSNYKYLKPHQIKSRLEVFKKTYCRSCKKRYKCDFGTYLNCEKKPQ